jgi:hypothetical protein
MSNDPIMGGKSTGNWSIAGGLGLFKGEVVDVPFLKAPGFIKVSGTGSFPDLTSCEGMAITAMSTNDYMGLRFSFGTAHAPGGGFFAYGYKVHMDAPAGSFQEIQLPFNNFTDYWNDGTGNTIKPCDPANPIYCPTESAKQDLKTMSFWGEGVGGTVDLSIESIKGYGCK